MQKRTRRASPSARDVDRFVKLYQIGVGQWEIASLTGYSRSTVRRALVTTGIAMRPKGRVPQSQLTAVRNEMSA